MTRVVPPLNRTSRQRTPSDQAGVVLARLLVEPVLAGDGSEPVAGQPWASR